MAFDFKKEYREYYLPPQSPVIVDIPPMNYVAVRGKGNPNEEDKCVQCMHVGSYDMEPLTIGKMKAQVAQEGLSIAIDDKSMHHEIYLSDPRKTVVDKLKTVIRYPVK